MTIRLRFFASLRERLGAEMHREVQPGTTLGVMWEAMRRDDEALGAVEVRFAVNEEYVDDDFVPGEGDEVAVFPPVSGGC